jgi:glycerol-3-phosphate acyltransferase PlsY
VVPVIESVRGRYTPPVDTFWRDAALIVGAYLAGSLPMGVIVARLTGGRDPRTVGSGRTGGTNAFRAMGPVRGVLVGLLDVAKGAVPALVARLVGAPDIVVVLVGLAAVLGAWRSVFLRFRGGRGVACGFGASLVIVPVAVLLAAPVFLIVVGVTRYISLGSILGAATAGLVVIVGVVAGLTPPALAVFAAVGVAFVWVAHADNIDRLLHGRERRFSFSQRERG